LRKAREKAGQADEFCSSRLSFIFLRQLLTASKHAFWGNRDERRNSHHSSPKVVTSMSWHQRTSLAPAVVVGDSANLIKTVGLSESYDLGHSGLLPLFNRIEFSFSNQQVSLSTRELSVPK
jgi:hypothetical protein